MARTLLRSLEMSLRSRFFFSPYNPVFILNFVLFYFVNLYLFDFFLIDNFFKLEYFCYFVKIYMKIR